MLSINRKALDEAGESFGVSQRRAVAEADQSRLQRQKPPGRAAVLGRVEREDRLGLAEHHQPVPDIDVAEHVPRDEDAVGSRQNEIWPAVCPGVSITVKVPTWSPSRSRRETGCGGPVQSRPTDPESQCRGILAMISPGVSIASASASPHQSGISSPVQMAWLAPWWSGWACVRACSSDRSAAQPAQNAPGGESRRRVDQDRSQRDRR